MEKSENELSNASCEYVYVFIGRVPLFGSPHNRDSSICGLLFFPGCTIFMKTVIWACLKNGLGVPNRGTQYMDVMRA